MAQAATCDAAPADAAALITAMANADTATTDCTLTLTPGAPYTLTAVNNSVPYNPTGLPVYTAAHTLTIIGNGATITRSAAGGTPDFRLFAVGPGAGLTLRAVTLSNGSAIGTPGTTKNGTTTLGTGTLAGGVATLHLNTLPPGNSVTATYGGDATYAASPASNAVSVSITAINCVVTSVQDPTENGKLTLHDAVNAADVGACVTPMGVPPTITFDSGVFPATTPTTITLTSDGDTLAITQPVTIDGSGHKVIVSGGGNLGLFAVSNSAAFTVNALTLTGGNAIGGGGAIAHGNGGGTVTFTSGSFSVTATLNGGSATVTTTALPVGVNQTITATYNGDGNFTTSSGTATATVNPATITVTAPTGTGSGNTAAR